MPSTNKGKNTPEETTTIRVRKSTKRALEKGALFRETHDGIIRRILELDKQNKKKAKQTAQDKEIKDKM